MDNLPLIDYNCQKYAFSYVMNFPASCVKLQYATFCVALFKSTPIPVRNIFIVAKLSILTFDYYFIIVVLFNHKFMLLNKGNISIRKYVVILKNQIVWWLEIFSCIYSYQYRTKSVFRHIFNEANLIVPSAISISLCAYQCITMRVLMNKKKGRMCLLC